MPYTLSGLFPALEEYKQLYDNVSANFSITIMTCNNYNKKAAASTQHRSHE